MNLLIGDFNIDILDDTNIAKEYLNTKPTRESACLDYNMINRQSSIEPRP